MRTMHTLKSDVQEKVDYYEDDESLIDAQERYYGEAESISEVDRMTHARWAGSAAKSEGITGAIVRDDFKTLLRGSLPTTNERIRWQNPNPENKERLAHDVVLSAPKSISMALHLEGDVRVFDAHTESVLETLDFIEKEAAGTRIQVNGIRSVVPTGNLIAALIPHHTSRDGDMQLHTHMLIMNGTKGPDGVWRSLCHEELASAEWVGSYYRQKLAEKVQALGYQIYTTKDGFELEGYSRDEIEVFSKRNRAIVREVMSKGLEVNPENKKDAVLTTRKAKSGVGQKLEAVQEQWRAEARLEGVNRPVLDKPLQVSGTLAQGKHEVDSAIRHLSETSVSFSRSEIYAYAFKHIHVKGLEIAHLNQAIAERKDLLPVQNGRMTTVDALAREIETIQKWNLGQGKAKPLMDAESAQAALLGSSLNSGQYEAVVKVASAIDRHLIIQGLSGVGKTHALGALKHLIQASGQDIVVTGYSPTIKAAQQLQDALGIETSTVESLIRRDALASANQIWVIDEGGMVSADQMLTIVNKAQVVGARILLVGDTGQNPSVKAGSPMKSLMYNGATTFRLSEIIRQQNSMQRRAVELIANGQPVDALRVLNEHGYVEQVQSQRERVQAIAQQYLGLDLTERSKTLIVTGTNTERQAITKAIREGLKAEDSLGQETTVLQLTNQYMSAEQKRRVENFEPGNYVQLLQDYKTTPLVKNKLYQVMGREGHELIVSSEGGRLYRLDPSKYGDKEVFKTEQFAVAVGDRLRWTASNRKAGQINGAEFTVIGMSQGQLIVADKKGTKIINLNQPLGVDYALVSTSYRAQGQTAKRVIVSATNGPTAAKEPFYVKISRQTHEIKVYAEDLERLKDWVQRSIAQENPLDLIGEQYGNTTKQRTEAGLAPEAHGSASISESGTTAAEQGAEKPVEQRNEYGTHHGTRGDAGVHSPVQGGTGQSKTIGDGGVNQAPGQSHGSPGHQTRQLGANSRPGGLVSGDGSRGNQGLQASAAQQRFSEVNEALVVPSRYVGLDDLAQTDRTIQDAQRLFDSPILERLEHLIDRLKQSLAQTPKPVYEDMAALVTGDRSESEERLLLKSGVLDGLEALGQTLHEGLTQSVTPKFEGLGELARMERDEQDVQQLLDSAIWEDLGHLAERLEPSAATERTQGYQNLGDIVQSNGLETELQLILESGLLERLESLNQTLTARLDSAQTPAYEGMNEHVQLNQLELDEHLLIENRVIERLEYLTQRLNDAQANITAQSYEGLGELISLETNEKNVRLVLESEIIDRLETLTNQLESRTGVQNDQINSPSRNPRTSTRANESDRPHLDLADFNQLAQSESGRNREGVRAAAQGIDERAAPGIRSITERLSGAIISSDVEETIRELARNCGEINAEYERVRFENEGRAGLESTLIQLTESVHRLDQQIGDAFRRERVNTIAGAIAHWRGEQQLGQTIAQFNEVIAAFGVDVSQPQTLVNELAQAIIQTNAEAEIVVAIGNLNQMLKQTQVPLSRPGVSQLAEVIQEGQIEQALIESLTQFSALIQSAQTASRPSVAEALAQTIGDQAIEDALVQSLTQLNQAITQTNTHASPAETLAQAIATTNLETELVENLERFSELLTQRAPENQERLDVEQIAALMNEWKAEGELHEAIAQFNHLMQSVTQVNAQASLAEILAQATNETQTESVIEDIIVSLNAVLTSANAALSASHIQASGLERPTHLIAADVAQSLLERRAEDVLNEHLAALSEATGSVLAELRQRPELAHLVETVQMLRADPAFNEGAAGQQLRELTQGVQKLNPESAMPIPKPKKPEVFWTPDYSTAQCPGHIDARHWEEMTRSAIHPDLIALNVRSLEGEAVYERLLSDRLATMGTGQYVTQPMARLMAQYESLTEGGWWGTAGIDAKSLVNLKPGKQPSRSTWGCFKGNNPRIDQDKTERKGEHQVIKYENPAGTERHLYLPIVPEDLAQKIYAKHGIQPTAAERKKGFWSVVVNHPEIPITITEGLKKTLASLSQGQVTIGLAGVNALYRVRDEDKQKLPQRLLNDEVAVFATPGRSVTFAFDRDAKTSTVFNVRRELVRGVELLEDRGCDCKIAKWKPEQGKGLDDLIAARGPQAYAKAIATAQPTDQEKRTYYRTEYNAISRQVKKTQPDIAHDALDIEVYVRAVAKGELKDGERFVSQSDQARSLKDPQQVAAYIEQVKVSAPQYRQNQRELGAARAQQAAERAEYAEIAQQVRAEFGDISGQQLDMEIYLRAQTSSADINCLLAQSDQAIALNNPMQVQAYVEQIKTQAPIYQQQQEFEAEQAQAQARFTHEQGIYQAIVQGAREAGPHLPIETIDKFVWIAAQQFGVEPERLLAHSERVRSNPEQAHGYIQSIKHDAAQYQQMKADTAAAQSPQAPRQPEQPETIEPPPQKPKSVNAIANPQKAQQKVDQAITSFKQELRAEYDAYAQQITEQLGAVPPEVLDMEVYLRAGQSDHAKQLIKVGDNMTALRKDNTGSDDFYCDAIKQVAPAYEEIKNDPNSKLNYKMMAAIVTNTNARLMLENNPDPTIQLKKKREDELML